MRDAVAPVAFDHVGVSDDEPGRLAVKTTMDALSAQTDLVVAQASDLGLSVEVS